MKRLGSTAKIAIGWTVVIATGLTSFVVARNLVIDGRRARMDTRQRIRDQTQKEGNETYERLEREKLEREQKSNMNAS